MTRQRAEGLGTGHQAWLNHQKDGRGGCTGVSQNLLEVGELARKLHGGGEDIKGLELSE